MRKLLLIAFLLLARNTFAQEAASTTQNPPPENRGAQTQAKPAEAPKLGHPLDPADVDVLTGKNKAGAQSPYGGYGARATPYLSYSLGDYGSAGSRMYDNSGNRLPFLPLLGRHSRATDFFFFDSSSFVGPRRFFFNHRAAANSFFFFSGFGRGGFRHH
jgi:hypothetical protein